MKSNDAEVLLNVQSSSSILANSVFQLNFYWGHLFLVSEWQRFIFFACQNNIFMSRNSEVLNVKASLAAANNFWREKFLFVIFFFWKWFVFMPPRRVEERNPIDNYQIRIGKCVHLISSDWITKCRKFLMAIMGLSRTFSTPPFVFFLSLPPQSVVEAAKIVTETQVWRLIPSAQ